MYLMLCHLEDIPDAGMKQFDLREREFLVAKVGESIYCLQGRCTHAGAPLAEGSIDGEILTCPWHYSQFNLRTGAVIRGPATDPLELYENRVEGGDLFVNLHEDEI
jgi:apoptosis-inducing factor 3